MIMFEFKHLPLFDSALLCEFSSVNNIKTIQINDFYCCTAHFDNIKKNEKLLTMYFTDNSTKV
jgi:hypothetical protein